MVGDCDTPVMATTLVCVGVGGCMCTQNVNAYNTYVM